MIKKLPILLFLIFGLSQAQKHEIGIAIGGNNLIADIGSNKIINPIPFMGDGVKKLSLNTLPLTLNLLYRRNLNPHYSLRLNLSASQFYDKDQAAKDNFRKERNLIADAKLAEVALLFEYTFYDINSSHINRTSPYIFAGVAGFGVTTLKKTGVYTGDPNTFELKNYSLVTTKGEKMDFGFALPIGVGLKYKRNFLVFFAEIGFRYTFSDEIDYSTTKNTSISVPAGTVEIVQKKIQKTTYELSNIGNPNDNDWYVHTNFGVTYTFGREKCYCN